MCALEEDKTNPPTSIVNSSPAKAKDIWDKLPVIASLSGVIIVPLTLWAAGGALDASIKRQNDILENKRISLQLTNAREKSDSDLKSSMFSKLLEKYESSANRGDPKQKLFFLELLVYNFSETLTLTPIINDLLVDFRQDPSRYKGLLDRLSIALREAAARQTASLLISGDQERFVLKKGKVKRLTLTYCKEDTSGSPSALRLPFQVKYIGIEPNKSSGNQNFLENGALVEVTAFRRDIATGKNSVIKRSFMIDESDLPLIDNMPLSDGMRVALMRDHEAESPSDNSSGQISLLALGFTNQGIIMKDKPSNLDYVKYLNDSRIINPASKRATNNNECNSLGPDQSVAFSAPMKYDFMDLPMSK